MAVDNPKASRPHRVLRPGQRCVVHTFDITSGNDREAFATKELLLEAPNWVTPATLILNGDGALWRLTLATGDLERLDIHGLPDVNNDHVPGADSDTMFVSGYDWHLHRVDLTARTFVSVTTDDPSHPMLHFLHGVSPDGSALAFVGIEPGTDGPIGPANIFTMASSGGPKRQLTTGTRPADGPEYSPDGEWIYFNTEAFSQTPGHAQIARMRTDGSDLTQLTFDDRVNWFPHVAPSGSQVCYLSYPPGTTGHPADLDVQLRLVTNDDWSTRRVVAHLTGGQGTINVNSWAPDSSSFAYVSYPLEAAQ